MSSALRGIFRGHRWRCPLMVTEEYKNDLEEHRENVVRTLRGFVDTKKLELGYKKDVSVKNG
jgi:hypothetical protein